MSNCIVTQEQLNACSPITDPNNEFKILFWMVESQSRPDRSYKVIWNEQYHVFQCSPDGLVCEASLKGVMCWHRRAVAVAQAEYFEALEQERLAYERMQLEREQAREAAIKDRLETLKRIEAANRHPYQWSEAEIKRDQKRFASRTFSLL